MLKQKAILWICLKELLFVTIFSRKNRLKFPFISSRTNVNNYINNEITFYFQQIFSLLHRIVLLEQVFLLQISLVCSFLFLLIPLWLDQSFAEQSSNFELFYFSFQESFASQLIFRHLSFCLIMGLTFRGIY